MLPFYKTLNKVNQNRYEKTHRKVRKEKLCVCLYVCVCVCVCVCVKDSKSRQIFKFYLAHKWYERKWYEKKSNGAYNEKFSIKFITVQSGIFDLSD